MNGAGTDADVRPEEATSEVPAYVLVPRPEQVAELKEIIAAVHDSERDRQRSVAFYRWAPWAFSIMAMAFVGAELYRDVNRPVAQDRFSIALVHGDGTYEGMGERTKLQPKERKVLLDYTVLKLVTAWEGYAFRGNQGNYDLISVLTTGEALQKVYQHRFRLDDPNSVDRLYGPDVTRDVTKAETIAVPGAPYAMDVNMLIRVKSPNASLCQRWQARITWREDDPKKPAIPIAVQELFDPMDIIFTSYDSHVDATAPGVVPCPA